MTSSLRGFFESDISELSQQSRYERTRQVEKQHAAVADRPRDGDGSCQGIYSRPAY